MTEFEFESIWWMIGGRNITRRKACTTSDGYINSNSYVITQSVSENSVKHTGKSVSQYRIWVLDVPLGTVNFAINQFYGHSNRWNLFPLEFPTSWTVMVHFSVKVLMKLTHNFWAIWESKMLQYFIEYEPDVVGFH